MAFCLPNNSRIPLMAFAFPTIVTLTIFSGLIDLLYATPINVTILFPLIFIRCRSIYSTRRIVMSSSRTYDKYVRQGIELYSRYKTAKEEIVLLTLKVCDIRYGGGSKDRYTLVRFASDIGMNRKTLSSWVNEYKVVTSKLDTTKRSDKDSVIVKRIMTNLNKDSSAREVQTLYNKEMKYSREDRTLKMYNERLHAILDFLRSHSLRYLDEDVLNETKDLISNLHGTVNPPSLIIRHAPNTERLLENLN